MRPTALLREIQVRDFALIRRLAVEFGPGLNVLTGETGAGKSLVIDALSLVLGGRASAEMVRAGAEEARVEAAFEVNDPALAQRLEAIGAPPEEGLVVLSREVSAQGRSRGRINGRLATAAALAQVSALLLEIHGQNEHMRLLSPSTQLELLDAYCGEQALRLREQVRALYQELRSASARLRELEAAARDRERQLELLRFQVEEIEAARLVPGEEEELAAERLRLAHAEQLIELSAAAFAALAEPSPGAASAAALLAAAQGYLRKAASLDPGLEAIASELDALGDRLTEVVRALRHYQDRIEADPERLAQVEERLDLIARLRRKYGADLRQVLENAQRLRQQVAALEGSEEEAARLRTRIAALQERLVAAASQLSEVRRAGAQRLVGEVERELQQLNMANSRFLVAVERLRAASGPASEEEEEDLLAGAEAGQEALAAEAPEQGPEQAGAAPGVGPTGADRVLFLLSANPGEPPRPLAKVASGGELSRVMLAFRTVLASADQIPILVFDEVDVGIGGRTAQAVAESLGRLGLSRQVLCVTHLPQIASMADRHYRIAKAVAADETTVSVQALDDEARAHELARMLGGARVTSTTLDHAREMIRLASVARRAG